MVANMDSPGGGRVYSRAKWNSLQAWQVHYTDAAAGHQMTAGGLQLSSLGYIGWNFRSKSLIFLRIGPNAWKQNTVVGRRQWLSKVLLITCYLSSGWASTQCWGRSEVRPNAHPHCNQRLRKPLCGSCEPQKSRWFHLMQFWRLH